MPSFEDLQTLWQKQPVRRVSAKQAAELTTAFRRYGRRNDIINSTKLLIVATQLVILTGYLRQRPMMLFGACVAIFSALFFLFRDWRNQRAVARLNFADPSTEFLHAALARLNALREPYHTREFYITLAGAFIGVNLMLESWAGHLFALAIPFGIYALARFVRGRRFARECQPLIDRLTAALKTMESQPV
ncbi:MAG: hypothetical protein JWP63_3344 [Candidatus Solibacter sp.]|jgi:hypothetical protein|nr:hypothetical protein [Candidatus Solibacter sp.]